MLARNTVVSCGVFAFDLALLWALVELSGMGKLLAAALAFIAANSIHYVFGRTWIFMPERWRRPVGHSGEVARTKCERLASVAVQISRTFASASGNLLLTFHTGRPVLVQR
jgi:putative flippase GtrA